MVMVLTLFFLNLIQMLAIESGCGLEGNPLHMVWASGGPSVLGGRSSRGQLVLDPQPHDLHTPLARSLEEDRDYESLTLMRLRQAQEKKRLAEQLQKEDEKCVL